MLRIEFTKIRAKRPKLLTKKYYLRDGKLEKDIIANLVEADLQIMQVGSLAEFADVIAGLTPNEAFVYGVPINRKATRIVTGHMLATGKHPEGTIARKKEHFEWPRGPGVWVLDHDPEEGRERLDRDGLVAALRDAVPGLRQAEMLWVPSASSHICNATTGEDLTGLRGQRLYIAVESARDIPRAGETLFERLWAKGHGYAKLTKDGRLLERTLVDDSVWAPIHLDFAAGAAVGPGLVQRRGTPILIEKET